MWHKVFVKEQQFIANIMEACSPRKYNYRDKTLCIIMAGASALQTNYVY